MSCQTSGGMCHLPFGWIVALLALGLIAGCQDQADLTLENAVIELSEASFYDEVGVSDRPVLIEFWAPWCQPCVEMQPMIEQLAVELSERVKVCRLNIDQAPEIAKSFEVNSPPVFLLLRDGQVLKRRSGKQTESAIREVIYEVSDMAPKLP